MMYIFSIKSITILLGIVMLLSCKNDLKEVNDLVRQNERPEMTGEDLEMIYSDSAKIQYKLITPLYVKINRPNEKYDEFPKGMKVFTYDKEGKQNGFISSKYAKQLTDQEFWEARNEVVVENEGKKLETELLFWDVAKGTIYTDRYVRLTSEDGQVIEGHDGFESDQNLEHPVVKNATGVVNVELEKEEEEQQERL